MWKAIDSIVESYVRIKSFFSSKDNNLGVISFVPPDYLLWGSECASRRHHELSHKAWSGSLASQM